MIEIVYQPSPIAWAKDRKRTALHVRRTGTSATFFRITAAVVGKPLLRTQLPALDNGAGAQEAVFYLAPLLNRRLDYQMPDKETVVLAPGVLKAIDLTVSAHDNSTAFELESTVVSLNVLKGALPRLADGSLHYPLLTVMPTVRYIGIGQEMYLYAYKTTGGTANLTIEYKCRYDNGTEQSHTRILENVPEMTVFIVPLGKKEAGYPTLVTGGYLEEVDVKFLGSTHLTLKAKEYGRWERQYHFTNTLGGVDTLTASSLREEKRKYENESSRRYEDYHTAAERHSLVTTQYRQEQHFKQYMGFMDRDEYRGALGILSSEQVWLQDRGSPQWQPITFTTVELEVEKEKEHLYAFAFSYVYSEEQYGQPE